MELWAQVGEQAGRVRLGIEGLAKRGLGYAQAAAPLAVSGTRGVACTAVGLQRIVLLDLVSSHALPPEILRCDQ